MLDNLTRRLSGIFAGFRGRGRLTEADVNEVMREVRVALLEADVNFHVAKDLITRIKAKAAGEEFFGSLSADQTVIKIVRDELTELLGSEVKPFLWASSPPTVVLMCGLQGSGKTTTTAKLAKWLKEQGKKPMLAACDIQRPAAIHQLQVLGEGIDVPVYADTSGASPVQIAKSALERCKHLMLDVLIVDTAGRLQIADELMAELKAIHQAVRPTEVFLVLDSTTGQQAVSVAEAFHELVPLTGAIFTKLDGDTRGGAVLSVKGATGVPVRFMGVGEGTEALEMFYPERMATRILGFGDVMGLIEKAQQVATEEEAKAMQAKMKTGALDFNDMLAQFKAIKKMGPLKNVMKMMPGMGQLPEEVFDSMDNVNMDKLEAIILSMTLKERSNPDIINGSRRKRIAAGSGTTVEDVNKLLKSLTETKKASKQLGILQQRMAKRQRHRR